ncbi:MAG: 50S ribosomal protein L1 [candidate division WWE3 bacterium]|nr:50S ribosomal protein L1 [candidate division WWE3 bacterium]
MNFLEALKTIREYAKSSKFDQTVELHLNLGIDPTKQEQAVKATLTLPNGTGKEKKVLLITADSAKTIADLTGGEEIVEKIIKGTLKPKVDFDAIVTTPEMMPKLARAAKILGPQGLMPSPKNGSVTATPEKAIAEIKKGQINLKTEKDAPVIHTLIGKLSFSDEKLEANFKAVIDALTAAKPAKVKGKFIKEIFLKATQTKAAIVEI